MTTQEEILRKHVLFQTSFTGVQKSPRSASPDYGRIRPKRRTSPTCSKSSISTTGRSTLGNKDHSSSRKSLLIPGNGQTDNRKSIYSHGEGQLNSNKTRLGSEKSLSTSKKSLLSSEEYLDLRRQWRSNRERPWVNVRTKLPPNKGQKIELFYEEHLPKDFDLNKATLKHRRYVTNSKYGNIYEIRADSPTRSEATPPPSKWLWEDDFLLWFKESRNSYLQEKSQRVKPINKRTSSSHSASEGQTDIGSVSSSNQQQAANKTPGKRKESKPNPEMFAYYNSYRLDKLRKRNSAILIQKAFRGYVVRSQLKRIKRKALFDHSKRWSKFISEYKETITRIQSRYGNMKPCCAIQYQQMEDFMDKKAKYEKAFRQVAVGEKLHKEDLMNYFKACDLHPLENEINKSFDIVFRGSGNTAEVVFMLDCSSTDGVVGFSNLLKFVKDMIMGLDVAPDRVRVGIVPYNEDIFNVFGITEHKTKMEVLQALSKVKVRPGLTRTDLALRMMMDMLKDSRPGVQKVGIVVTDGKSSDPERTSREAKLVHESGIEMFAIGVGANADEQELKKIASSEDHLFFAYDHKSLVTIKRRLEKRFCLAACTLCQNILPRIVHEGLLMHEALDIIWTTYPPASTGITICSVCDVGVGDNNAYYTDYAKHRGWDICRPIYKQEALEVVWTTYPPDACDLRDVRKSRWIRPVVDGTEAWSLLDDIVLKDTDIRTCLRLVIQSRLERNGYIEVPSDVREGVEKVTNQEEALTIVERYMKSNKANVIAT